MIKIKTLVLFIIMVFTFTFANASGVLSESELNFVDSFIEFLKNIDLDGIHATLSAIITALIVLLGMFKKRLKKYNNKP